MTEQEIDKKIEAEFEKFMQGECPNVLPKNFIELFKKAVMHVSWSSFAITAEGIEIACVKQVKKLTLAEAMVMGKVVDAVPPAYVYSKLEEAVASKKRLKEAFAIISQKVDEKRGELKASKITMASLIKPAGSSLFKA